MKTWQIFLVGISVLVAAILFPSYERFVAGMAATAMVAVVAAGFVLRPQRDVFYLRTTLIIPKLDFQLSVEHDRIAVKVELVRMWLLFLPTFAAIAFFVVTSATSTTWDFSLLSWFGEHGSFLIYYSLRAFQIIVVAILSAWISERWVLHDAEAANADTISVSGGLLLYSFKDRGGEFYGGDGVPLGRSHSPQLARIVFYRSSNAQQNKIAMALLFHRVVIVGRGLTDLDEAEAAAHPVAVEPMPDLS